MDWMPLASVMLGAALGCVAIVWSLGRSARRQEAKEIAGCLRTIDAMWPPQGAHDEHLEMSARRLREIMVDESEDIHTRTNAGHAYTQMVQAQAAEIGRKPGRFEHSGSTT